MNEKIFTVELIGDGPARKSIEKLINRLRLDKQIKVNDPVSHIEIRNKMSKSDIFIFPSNHKEGWGAVVGEAMSEGCVVIANKQAGSSEILIESGKTGFLFDDKNAKELSRIIEYLIKNEKIREQVGVAAASSMLELWDPKIAASRFVRLCEGLLKVKSMPQYQKGPCSSCIS